MSISLRASIPSQLGPRDLSNGFIKEVTNDFWDTNREKFPFQTEQGGISLRKMVESWNSWPDVTDFFKEDIHPDDSDTPNWTEDGQGITTSADGLTWFFGEHASKSDPRVWQRDTDEDLDSEYPAPIQGTNFSGVTDSAYLIGDMHFGGMDFHNGDVLVAVHDGAAIPSRIFRFRAVPTGSTPKTISFRDGTNLPNTGNLLSDGDIGQIPWIAVIHDTELAATSEFNKDDGSPDPVQLFFYDLSSATWGPTGDIDFLGTMGLFEYSFSLGQALSVTRRRIQGAAFGAHEHFYFISDMPDDEGGGIYAVDIISGFVMFRLRPSLFGAPESTGGDADPIGLIEYQDLCVFDTTNVTVHPKSVGALHLLIHHSTITVDDNHSILHMSTTAPENV